MTQPNLNGCASVPARSRQQSGMTLVETVVALFIAVFLIAGILTSVMVASKSFMVAKARTNATNVLNQQIEDMRSMEFGVLKSTLATPGATNVVVKVGNMDFRIERVSSFPALVGATPPAQNLEYIECVITVYWSISGRSYSSIARTSFSKYGFAAQS